MSGRAKSDRLFYEIKAKADDDHAEILIYQEIGESFWGDTVDAKSFVSDLQELDVSQITVRINSPGGSVFDGVAIYNALKQHRAKVTTRIDGLAASIASIVALAGDEVVIAKNAMMMIHNPWSWAMGDSAEMRKTADLLDKLRDMLVGTYAQKTGQTPDVISAEMSREAWYEADEAVEFGLADSIHDEDAPIAALARFDAKALTRFQHAPDRLVAMLREEPADPASSDDDPVDVPSAGIVSGDNKNNPAPKAIDPQVAAGLMAFPH